VKTVVPTGLMREAASVLAPVRDEVVVFGAVALQVALSGSRASVAPTRDVDLAVRAEDAGRVVAELERAGLTRSLDPYEAGHTWVRGDLKVQLVRPFHPFPRGVARDLPQQTPVAVAAILVPR
jgi:hypothetical protein